MSESSQSTQQSTQKVEDKKEEKKVDEKSEEFKKWRSELRGKVYLPGETGYDEARDVWNNDFIKSPAIIIEPESAYDITRGLKYAHEHKLPVRVKCGGHSFSGRGTGDGVLQFNMRKLNWVNVNVEEKTAWIGGGCLLEDVDKETTGYGLWTTMGTYPRTGVGLALHGGFGFLSPKHGLAVDNILEADVVTPDGKLIRVSPTQNDDLFWAIRGAAAHVGIVVQFKTQLYPALTKVYGGLIIWDAIHYEKLATYHSNNLKKHPLEFDCLLIYASFEPMGGKHVCIGIMGFVGSEEKGKEVIDGFRAVATPLVDHAQGCSYVNGLQKMTEPLFSAKASYYFTSRFLKGQEVSKEFLEIYTKGLAEKPNGVLSGIEDFYGISQEKKSDFNAFSTRSETFGTLFIVASPAVMDSKQKEIHTQNILWVKTFIQKLEPFLAPVYYYNYSSDETTTTRKRNWGDNYDKLESIKKKYDPEGILPSLLS